MLTLDNHDPRIRYVHLQLERTLPLNLPEPPLPAGYRFAFYRPGDRDAWIGIEQSSREFDDYGAGLAAWNDYFAGHDGVLTRRMLFIENDAGEKVATASAYWDKETGDDPALGWLHWVAVRREDQGRGLAKPLIARTLGVMHALGYPRATIPTQTITWLACRIYLDFGFLPTTQSLAEARDGWRFIRTVTEHPALRELPPIDPTLLLND